MEIGKLMPLMECDLIDKSFINMAGDGAPNFGKVEGFWVRFVYRMGGYLAKGEFVARNLPKFVG